LTSLVINRIKEQPRRTMCEFPSYQKYNKFATAMNT